jgi:hypothetical protein
MLKALNFIARFLSLFVKTYKPQGVFVSKSALSYPRTKEMIKRIKKLNRKCLLWIWTLYNIDLNNKKEK